MNVGITTFQWSDNYGAVLQAHALQSFLQQRGHVVQIIDYRPWKDISFIRKWLAKTPCGCINKWEQVWKEHLFEKFRSQYLERTPEVFRSCAELDLISDRFDLLITGSDQVWNPLWLAQCDGLSDLYTLVFAAPRIRRISYAASIGHTDKTTIDKSWQKILGDHWRELDAISVRERSGIALVHELCGRNDAVPVVDPTLLLGRAHYEKIAGNTNKRRNYLFNYMLHGLEKNTESICSQIAEEHGLKIVNCNVRWTKIHHGYVLPFSSDWLRYIRDAFVVVTNSFHGVIFCLIFHVPFIVLLIEGQIGSMNSRIIDLLHRVELSPRIMRPGEEVAREVLNEKIDWNSVDRMTLMMKTESVQFLEQQNL